MGHIHLCVSDLTQAETFYRHGLGFDVVSRYGTQALFLSTGGYHHHIGLNTWAGMGAPSPSENSVGLKTFVLNYPNKEARKNAIQRLKQIGTPWIQESGIIQTKDPSGNVIRLSTYHAV
ncbi:Glyoxalase/Bleomycin resistance protein/Dioxygenase superfamily protein [Melghirimyces algeriensis]|uniref:Glyoxalase/Bleomycin resistance protein/Dioxygenase superfamily protein n=1 Tax=Melghirimyces algeriensis TaxID=910412 RepID=A0A521BPS3_9BACL|nr:Glyoxalase/Bleomycin resistance protein/Dioxygenase superfamily protein [Melghirimyces algeriensis]